MNRECSVLGLLVFTTLLFRLLVSWLALGALENGVLPDPPGGSLAFSAPVRTLTEGKSEIAWAEVEDSKDRKRPQRGAG